MSILLELKKNTELVKKLSRSLEEAVFTVAVLRKASCADISSLKKRILCQKIIYFAGRLGLSPAYNFNMYVHGPYSPYLAKDLFTLENKFTKITPVEFVLDENKKEFKKINNLVSKSFTETLGLEIAATLDFFNCFFDNKTKAIAETKKIKIASDKEIKEAEEILAKLGVW